MTWLECLSTELADGVSAEELQQWEQAERATLPRLTYLTALALAIEGRGEATLTALPQLPRLQRLWLWGWHPFDPAALSGPWLGSLRWLGMEWPLLERAAGALRAAPRLEYVCSLSAPVRADEGRWRAAWDFLATHPPLRCFAIDIQDEAQFPGMPAIEALMRLHNHRPSLQMHRPRPGCTSFYTEVMDSPGIPSLKL